MKRGKVHITSNSGAVWSIKINVEGKPTNTPTHQTWGIQDKPVPEHPERDLRWPVVL